MNITVERQSDCEALLRVEIPAEAVNGERTRIVQSFASQARIPGYRPGKVPRSVIEKRFGEEIARELESRLVRQAYQEAIEKDDLRVLNAKSPEDTVHHPDGALSFSSELTLAPQFDLPDYKGLTLEIPEHGVSEEDVDRELQNLRNRFADFTDIDDRPLQDGDFGIIDYNAQLEGKPLEEALGQSVGYLASGQDYWLKMEEDSLLPGFAAALEGTKIGEERDFNLTVPEEFEVEELRGVELAYTVTVKGVKEQVLPELNDELAGQILPDKTLEELKEVIETQLVQQLSQRVEEFKVNQLLEKLNQGVEFELPSELVTAETQGQADEMVERGMGAGMSEEEIEAQQGEIFAAASQRARMNLRTDFILQRIAEAEEIAVEKEALMRRIAAMAQRAKKPVKAFARELQQSGRLSNLQHSMLLSKTIDFLLEHANVQTVEAPEAPAEESPSDDE